MRSSQLFVPPRIVERRRVELAPDLSFAWRLVAWTGIALFAAFLFDAWFSRGLAALASSPWIRPTNVLADAGHLLLISAGLLLASAAARGRWRETLLVAAVASGFGVILIVTAIVQAVGAPSLPGASADPILALVRRARVRSLGLALLYAGALITLGAAAWRHARRHAHVPIAS